MKRQKRTTKEKWRIFKLRFKSNWFVSWITSQYIQAIRLFLFASAKRKARRWHKRTKKRFYVIPTSNYAFTVMCNLQRKNYNRKVGQRMGISFKRLDSIEYWNTGLFKGAQPKVIKPKKKKVWKRKRS